MPAKRVKVRAAAPVEFGEVAAFCAGREHDDATREIRRRRERWLADAAAGGLGILVALDGDAPPFLTSGAERLARDELTSLVDGLVVGLLQYSFIEETLHPVTGEGYLVLDCLWVLPPYLGCGVGRALMNGVIREARAQRAGVAVVAYRGASPFPTWAHMPEAFFRRFGFEAVAAEADRVLMAVNYGAAGKPAFVPAAARAASGTEYLCHPCCPASLWGAAEVKRQIAERGLARVSTREVASRDEVRSLGALWGVCQDGRVVVNRLAFWRDVARVLGLKEEDGVTP